MTGHLTVQQDGRLEADGPAREALKSHSGRFRLVEHRFGVLSALSEALPDGMVLQGDLRRIHLADLLPFLALVRLNGVFRVHSDAAVREIILCEGEVRGVRSSVSDERVGELAVRMGMLKEAHLETISNQVGPDRKFGGLALEEGWLTEGQLWLLIQEQVTTVMQSLLTQGSGRFVFFESDTSAVANIPGLSTEHLVFESMRRSDELARYRQRVPSADIGLEVSAGPLDALGGMEWELAEQARRPGLTLAQLAQELRISEFDATRAAYRLAEMEVVSVRVKETSVDDCREQRIGMVACFATCFRDIFQTAKQAGVEDSIRRAARDAFAGDPAHAAAFRDFCFGEDGDIDTADFLDRFDRLAPPAESASGELLLELLSKSVLFLLFVAGEHIKGDAHQALHRRVKSVLVDAAG